jgi:hypothetical protein
MKGKKLVNLFVLDVKPRPLVARVCHCLLASSDEKYPDNISVEKPFAASCRSINQLPKTAIRAQTVDRLKPPCGFALRQIPASSPIFFRKKRDQPLLN